MTMTESNGKELSVVNKIINIFTAPRETFQSLDQNPGWLVPFIITTLLFVGMQYFTVDIRLSDQLAALQARDIPPEAMDRARSQIESPFSRYAGFVLGPLFMLAAWAVIAGIIFFAANMFIGKESAYKKVFSVIAWSSLVGIISIPILTFLATSKGTFNGLAFDLSAFLDTPAPGQPKSLLYHILSRFDLFTFWQLALWSIGLSVLYRVDIRKAATPVAVLWVIYAVIAVAFGSLFGSMFGM